jgi:hypothetical protein
MSRIRFIVLAAAVGLVVLAGVGYAAIPSADGTISACKSSKGALKVIDVEAGQSCPDGQQLLAWNQQGRQGEPGSALGYALVADSGGVIDSSSSNVSDANVTHAGVGVYCFHDLPFDPKHAVVTLVPGVSSGSGPLVPEPLVATPAPHAPCTGDDAMVMLVDPASGVPSRNGGFYILFN